MQNAIWATRIVIYPRANPMKLKKINVATARTISGTMMGSEIRPKEGVRRRYFPPRTIAVAAAVAIAVAKVAAMMAIENELIAACWNFALSGPTKISTYQRRERPRQVVIDSEALNE